MRLILLREGIVHLAMKTLSEDSRGDRKCRLGLIVRGLKRRSSFVISDGGVSQPAVPGIAVKLLAKSASDLTRIQDALWAAVRAELWNLPPVAWRKY